MQIELLKFPYSYMEYEKILQIRELKVLLPEIEVLSDDKHNTIISGERINLDNVKELTFYRAYKIDGISYPTRQGLYEKDDTLRAVKQHTRYSTHGIHEYKGKFNPQIVHAIANIFGVQRGHKVLDPFDGSGTTIVECAHAGIEAYGTDINPLACLIANTKVAALKMDVEEASVRLYELKRTLSQPMTINIPEGDERLKYLSNWIPMEILCMLESIRNEVENDDPTIRNFFLVVASDLIRDYSYQEPSDLRIRRRKSPMPEVSFLEAYLQKASKYLQKIEQAQSVEDKSFFPDNHALNCDIKYAKPFGDIKFDAAITSPPYVTALPYIDTQRISLVWLGLCSASEIGRLEASLIGSRELLKSEKNKWASEIAENTGCLPAEIYKLVCSMNESLNENDGFRKQAVPTLVYKYFTEMKSMFINVRSMMKPSGLYGLVVGHNKTTLGGTEYNIDTPYLLAVLAQQCGWQIEELFPLQTYKRYGLNAKNAINRETLIVLRNA